MKILIADDEPSVRESLGLLLRRRGFETTAVEGGEAALRAAEEVEFDLVLLDVFLPDLTGIEVCRRLKARCEHFLPIILVTGKDSLDTKVDGLEGGADDYLVKPFDSRVLLARVKALCRIKTLHDQVRRLAAVREQIVYTVSHDFKTPLVGIRGAIQNLLKGLVGELSDEQREYLELVDQAAERLKQLAEEMTLSAQLQRADEPLAREPVDLREAAETAIAGLGPAIVERSIDLDLDVDEESPPAWGDPAKITRVLANLLDNAVKYAPAGGKVSLTVGSWQGKRGPRVHIVVSDDGPGIARSDFERIFYRFEQVGAPDETTADGVGLGLAICKDVVEDHGGRIWVESDPGAGSRFHVLLPIVSPKRGAA